MNTMQYFLLSVVELEESDYDDESVGRTGERY